jgi:hypothetical protein
MQIAGKPPLVRSVRAGDLFLSQSSKWLHFGLGEGDVEIESVAVTWPGGDREAFSGVSTDGRFRLRQGEGEAERASAPAATLGLQPRPSGGLMAYKEPSGARVVLPVKAPLTAIHYRDRAAKARVLAPVNRSRWLVFWEGGCGVCEHELTEIKRRHQALQGAGVEVVALSANGIESAGEAYDLIDRTGFGGEWGFVDPASLSALWAWVEAWFDRVPEAGVPFSVLLDAEGDAVALYFGAAGVDDIIADTRLLIGIDPVKRWHLAPPFEGSWFTQPPDPNYVRAVLKGR